MTPRHALAPSTLPGALLAALLIAAATPAAATEVKSFVEPPTTQVGGSVVFVIEVRSDIRTRVRFPPRLDLTRLERLSGPNIGQSIYAGTQGSGRLSRVSWQLLAVEEGTARIGPATIEVAGEAVEVPGASVEVAPSSGRGPGFGGRPGPGQRDPLQPFRRPGDRRTAQQEMYLRAEAAPLEPWVGQQVVYTLWVYTTGPFSQPNLEVPARFPGFWAEDVDLGDPSALFERVWVEGRMYLRVPLLRRLLFPLAEGEQTVEPIVVSVEPERMRFDPFARRGAARRIKLTSNPVEIEARALPEPPADFSGVVGELEVEAELAPGRVAVGEHATLAVEVTGHGNLQGLSAPRIATPAGLELLAPGEDGGKRVAGVELSGRRTWRYPVVPRAVGAHRLPAPEVVYFDPADGRYQRAAGEVMELTVTPQVAIAEDGPDPSADGSDSEPAGWWAHLAERLRTAGGGQWTFPALAGAVLLALGAGLSILVLHRRRRIGVDGPAGLWRRQLEAARSADRPRRAAAAIEAAWRQLLAERWRISPDIPPASWEDSLRHAGAQPHAAAELGELIRELQSLRRAPELSSISALTDDLIARSLRLERPLG